MGALDRNKKSFLEFNRQKTSEELIELIISKYHEGLRQLMPDLIGLAEKVERVHRAHSSCPHGLAKLLFESWHELQLHLEKEERILFPLLKSGDMDHIQLPAQMIFLEHYLHKNILGQLRDLRTRKPLPENACRTWRTLDLKLDLFETQMQEHILLEDEVLLTPFLSPPKIEA